MIHREEDRIKSWDAYVKEDEEAQDSRSMTREEL